MHRRSFFLTVIAWAFFVIFSYAYIDVNLTLSSWGPYQAIQQQLFQLGYFHRLWATAIYVVLLLILFGNYIFLLRAAQHGALTNRSIVKVIILVGLLLVFAYPAFSHDIFNYVFYGKIMTVYRENPYLVRALDFPSDPWVRFMRWTHGYAPYGPILLGMTVIPSLLGFGKFTATLFMFKLFMFSGFVLGLWAIARIVKKVAGERYVASALVLFGLNPLVLIEGIVSAHNDLVFMSFALLGIAALVYGKKWMLWVWLSVSVGIKYATVGFVLPFLLYQMRRISWVRVWWMLLSLMTLAAVIASMGIVNQGSTGGEFLPWYVLWPLVIVALRPTFRLAIWLAIAASIGGLLYYVPYMYFGDYRQLVVVGRMVLFYLPIIIAGSYGILRLGLSGVTRSVLAQDDSSDLKKV